LISNKEDRMRLSRVVPPVLALALATLGCNGQRTSVGRDARFDRTVEPAAAAPAAATEGTPVAAHAPADGKAVYASKCAPCHGDGGTGEGPAAYLLYPKPRDFTRGVFKFRSTPTGELPTDADLLRTVTRGVPGTSMPAWRDLAEAERLAVVAHLKTLSPAFEEEPEPEPIEIGEPPALTAEAIAAGRVVYERMKCGECHGDRGRGDGPAADTLRDDWGQPILAYDFTRPNRFKGGSTPEDVYRTFTTGLAGTPMPAYGDLLEEEERWQLTGYVLSLASAPETAALSSENGIACAWVDAPLEASPTSAVWADAPRYAVPLRLLWSRPVAAEQVLVSALTNGTDLAVRLEWSDAIADEETLRPEDFRDACAVQFPLEGQPLFAMGERGAGGLVNIWHWKADWQADLDSGGTGGFRDIEAIHAGMAVDRYPFERSELGRQPLFARRLQDPGFLTGQAAGNLFSSPNRPSPVEDLVAAGFGTLTSQPLARQNVRGRGIWRDGRWEVVFVRSLEAEVAGDAAIALGRTIPAAFAVWDGAQGDRNGKKAVTDWVTLALPESKR
jgi:mono/diheme cytochrome c family protein